MLVQLVPDFFRGIAEFGRFFPGFDGFLFLTELHIHVAKVIKNFSLVGREFDGFLDLLQRRPVFSLFEVYPSEGVEIGRVVGV